MHTFRGWSLMRLLDIDKRTFWYANYVGRQMLLDENGGPTGERSTEYAEPTEAEGTFSMPNGAATAREFGSYIDYDYVIHLEEEVCPFDEEAAIWLNNTTDQPPDFKVVRISEPRTYVAVAIRQLR